MSLIMLRLIDRSAFAGCGLLLPENSSSLHRHRSKFKREERRVGVLIVAGVENASEAGRRKIDSGSPLDSCVVSNCVFGLGMGLAWCALRLLLCILRGVSALRQE